MLEMLAQHTSTECIDVGDDHTVARRTPGDSVLTFWVLYHTMKLVNKARFALAVRLSEVVITVYEGRIRRGGRGEGQGRPRGRGRVWSWWARGGLGLGWDGGGCRRGTEVQMG